MPHPLSLTGPERKKFTTTDSSVLRRRVARLRGLALSLVAEIETIEVPETFAVEAPVDFYTLVRRFEIALIQQALRRTGNSQVKAALLLNLKVTTLNSKIKALSMSCGDDGN